MSKQGEDDWVSSTVTILVILTTALTKPSISLTVAFVAMMGMAFYYRRRSQSWLGTGLAMVGAAVIAGAIAFLLVKGRFH
jgi:hypothetical protein